MSEFLSNLDNHETPRLRVAVHLEESKQLYGLLAESAKVWAWQPCAQGCLDSNSSPALVEPVLGDIIWPMNPSLDPDDKDYYEFELSVPGALTATCSCDPEGKPYLYHSDLKETNEIIIEQLTKQGLSPSIDGPSIYFRRKLTKEEFPPTI